MKKYFGMVITCMMDVFQNGSIVEIGCHTDLLEKNGVYAEMWRAYTQQGKEVLHK